MLLSMGQAHKKVPAIFFKLNTNWLLCIVMTICMMLMFVVKGSDGFGKTVINVMFLYSQTPKTLSLPDDVEEYRPPKFCNVFFVCVVDVR
jgi:hypothetical protein